MTASKPFRAGLIVRDTGDGDAHWSVVDAALWRQILDLRDDPALLDASRRHPRTGGPCWDAAKYASWVDALTCTDEGVEVPSGCPTRQGAILKEFYTQAPVVEEVTLDGIVGVLTLR